MMERVLFNVWSKKVASSPDIWAFGDWFLATVRAGLAFSGEADAPLKK